MCVCVKNYVEIIKTLLNSRVILTLALTLKQMFNPEAVLKVLNLNLSSQKKEVKEHLPKMPYLHTTMCTEEHRNTHVVTQFILYCGSIEVCPSAMSLDQK